jgi:HSP20 family protein
MALIRLRDNSGMLSDFQSQMNQLFDSFLGQNPAAPVERAWTPLCDVWETPDEMVISVEMPGFTEKDIRLSVTGDQVLIQGERRWEGNDPQKATFHRRERWYGKVERAFSLPLPVESSKVVASYRDGILTVRLPKAEGVKPREIKVQAG